MMLNNVWLEWFEDDQLVCDCDECKPHTDEYEDPESCNCPQCSKRHVSIEDLQLFCDPKGFIKREQGIQPKKALLSIPADLF